MIRKLLVCSAIFASLFTGFMILDNKEDRINGERGVLRIQQSGVSETNSAIPIQPFKAREYVRIVPR